MGFELPAGTRVAMGAAIYAMCRSRLVFGEDADVFRPERWLEAEEAARVELEALDSSSSKQKRRETRERREWQRDREKQHEK